MMRASLNTMGEGRGGEARDAYLQERHIELDGDVI
jgi:hypothetical protein